MDRNDSSSTMPDSVESVNSETFNRMIRFMDITFNIKIDLGTTSMKIKNILNLGVGSIIYLNKSAGESIDVFANGKLIAKGEIIVMEDNFDVRITDVVQYD